VEHDLDLRLPHPGGGLDGGAGARVHARERDRLRVRRARGRPLARRVRRPPLLLLQRPQPLLPGGGEIPRRAAALGADHARPIRRDQSEGACAALPCADRGLDPDGAAAGEQRRARRDPGAVGRRRRCAVAAHERLRRAGGRADRAAPARPRGGAPPGRANGAGPGGPERGRGGRRAGRGQARRGRRREPPRPDAGGAPGALHDRRDLRRAARGVRDVRRAALIDRARFRCNSSHRQFPGGDQGEGYRMSFVRGSFARAALLALAGGVVAFAAAGGAVAARGDDQLQKINQIVVIYEENHSFDNLYGGWEGVNGRANADAAHTTQVIQSDAVAPPVYTCLMQNDVNLVSAPGPVYTDTSTGTTFTSHFTNQPFSIEASIPASAHTCPVPGASFSANGYLDNPSNLPGGCTRDIVHRFYQEQYQLNHGRQNLYVTGSDAVGLAMGYYNTSALPIYTYLHSDGHPHYAIADDFFQSAFGGSFLNHQWL